MPTVEEVLAEVRKNNRICPQPSQWQQLYELLPNKKRMDGGWNPPLPLILAAWWDTPAALKSLRLREHIEWASAHGCLDQVHQFLLSLPETDWHHLED